MSLADAVVEFLFGIVMFAMLIVASVLLVVVAFAFQSLVGMLW